MLIDFEEKMMTVDFFCYRSHIFGQSLGFSLIQLFKFRFKSLNLRKFLGCSIGFLFLPKLSQFFLSIFYFSQHVLIGLGHRRNVYMSLPVFEIKQHLKIMS